MSNEEITNLFQSGNNNINNLGVYFRNFDFKKTVFTNTNLIKKELGLTYIDLLNTWHHYSNKKYTTKCYHCGFQDIKIPNELKNLSGRIHITKYNKNIPSGLFCFINKDNTEKLLNSISNMKDNKKELWNNIKINNNMLPKDFISVCCYYCYNFYLLQNNLIMENVPSEMNICRTIEGQVEYEYKYTLPYLLNKGKCIYYNKDHYCCNNIELLNNDKNKSLKNDVLNNSALMFHDNINLFLCEKHMKNIV